MTQFEPEYTDDYDEFGELHVRHIKFRPKVGRPKWSLPRTEFDERMLSACGRKYFADRGEAFDTHRIGKAMMSLKRDGVLSIYPAEWIEHCIAFAALRNASAKGTQMIFPNLLKYINNEEKRTDWIANFMKREAIELKPSDQLEDFTDYGN